jgi:hypothetical protein
MSAPKKRRLGISGKKVYEHRQRAPHYEGNRRMTDTVPTPVVVNPSQVPDAIGSLVRDVMVIAAALPIVVKLVGARDLTGLLQWLQSSDGATAMAVALAMAASGWRAWLAMRKKATLVTVAESARDDVAVVQR